MICVRFLTKLQHIMENIEWWIQFMRQNNIWQSAAWLFKVVGTALKEGCTWALHLTQRSKQVILYTLIAVGEKLYR